jgi:hypothetical protein
MLANAYSQMFVHKCYDTFKQEFLIIYSYKHWYFFHVVLCDLALAETENYNYFNSNIVCKFVD